ncbi:MAG: acyl-CoA synthetase [Bacteroidetes bacterium HGW-Bacteroidetes-14]|nr:MAG: acyl-CoA synthetase [Bacteroidetes bacterium HGW-Bacteroidetes-14]
MEFNTLKDLFNYSIDKYKNNNAFAYVDGKSYTYEQLGKETQRVNEILLEAGIGVGAKVALLGQNMPTWPVAYFSAVAFNRIIVPILPDFAEAEVRNVIEHSESTAMFVSQRLAGKVPADIMESLSVVIDLDTLSVLKSKENKRTEITSDPQNGDLAAIIYTSGTTGNSKGVMLSHKNLCSQVYAVNILRPTFDWDVWLSVLPLSHTMESSLSMLLPMTAGASVFYMEKAPTPSLLVQALAKVKPTTMLSVPLIIEKIYRNSILPKFNSSPVMKAVYGTTPGRKLLNKVAGKKLMKTFGGRIRFFGIGGAKLDGDVERFLIESKFPYAIGYGLTETAPLLAGAVGKLVKWQSTGPAMHGVTLRIDNPNPENGEGEIVAKSPSVMMGYYKNPDATEQAFTADGYFRTKDLGIIDKDGRLYIKGRLSNMILGPSGENIYPEEIESVINGHPMVAESVVTQQKGKLVALVHFNPDKLKALEEAKEEAIAAYYEKKEQLMHSFEEKKEQLMHTYEETKDAAVKIFNEKIEQLKREVYEYVNTRVNKFSKISAVKDQPHQFEKTATQKIKRYLYTDKKK